MRFKIDWANVILGSKFSSFALFYFAFEGNFPRTSSWGAYIWKGDLTEGFSRYRFGGLILGGAYFRDFTVIQVNLGVKLNLFILKQIRSNGVYSHQAKYAEDLPPY